jgi:hypothetical protein
VKTKRSHIIIAVMALVVGIVWVRWFWFADVFRTHKSNGPQRAAILQIRDAVALDTAYSEVLAAYWEHRTDSLRLFADSATNWVITMPFEFGANDWNLRIEFEDGKVSAVRVRTSDGPPPKDGPTDKRKQEG